jgi:electron transport complex protein RnfB
MWISIATATLIITGIALAAGLGLSYASSRLPEDRDRVVESINRLLPQTQCAQCGFPGCRPYAESIAQGDSPINLCPPGGDDTIRRIADLLGTETLALVTEPVAANSIAIIDESLCIGCTHCRNACPVDAITGAHQFMHTIISSECTGCELCVAPCPVDCISMVPAA